MAKPIDPEIKAAALADVLAGMSLHAASRKYGVTRQAIMDWQDKAGVTTPVLPLESRFDVGSALGRFMCATLDALTEQVGNTRQVNWLELDSQRVDAFTKLYRVLTEGVAGVVAAQEMGAAEEEPTPIRRAG